MTSRYLHAALVAFGIAILCLLAIFGPLLSPSHTVIYHTSGPVPMLFQAVLADLFALWALIVTMLVVAERPGHRQVILWSGIILSLPWIVLKNISMLAGFPLPSWLSASMFILSLAAFAVLSIFWRPSFLPAFEQVQRLLRTVFSFVALSGIIVVAQLLWFARQARGLNSPVPLHQRAAGSVRRTPGGRVIWILLDELSYQQIYEQRFSGLSLPAFDSIASEASVFTHVIPSGAYTEEIVPALISGTPVDRIRVSSSGRRLSLHDPDTERWQVFDPHQTVFQDALNAGYSTAVAGWYNPYCRILASVLDRCFWTFQLPYPGGIVPDRTPAGNLLRQLTHAVSSGPDLETELHIADYRDLRRAADSILADSHADFVFLHLPIPHPAGIYNRRTGRLTTGQSSYIDNLALADSYVAHVHDLLQRRGEWDSSTIMITGDHSWRTSFVWSKSTSWTAEDEAASHGAQFDDRPAYIVKLPHQQQAMRIDTAFDVVNTRSLLDTLIAGRLHSADDLAGWVRKVKEQK